MNLYTAHWKKTKSH